MPKLSVVIITFNEEKNIARCIDSVEAIADDIVVVDSFSTDKTEELCKSRGVRFIQHKFEGHIEQKNWAITQALYPHVLSLDADESLDEKLKKSILEIKNNWQQDGYYINRLTNYCGTWVHHCGWYPDKKLRLWDSRKGAWGGTNPHDKYELVEGDTKTGHLEGDILHYSYYTKDDHYKQVYYFTEILAKAQYKEGKAASLFQLYFSPIVKFIRDYIIKLGVLDGKAGYGISRISAYASYLKYKGIRNLHLSNGASVRDKINTIIISRPDAIGDVILTLPMCGLIKKYYPNTKIIFLGKTYTQAVINCCEYVDEFINADELFKLNETEASEKLMKLNADAIIHVFPNKKIAKLAKKADISKRIGTRNRLFHWFTVNKLIKLSRKNSNLHEAQLNCTLLRGIDIKRCPELNELYKFTGFTKLPTLNTSIVNSIDNNKINIVLHPKSNASAREWSLNNFKQLTTLLPNNKYTFYISGTAKEQELLADWLKDLSNNVIDITGKLSLDEFIQFISKVDYLVAASTGPLHIAAATGIGAIGIYPPIKPMHPGRWQPIGKNVSVACVKKTCSDCRNNPQKCHCMNEITAAQIAALIENDNH